MNSDLSIYEFLSDKTKFRDIPGPALKVIYLETWLISSGNSLFGIYENCRRDFISNEDAIDYLGDCAYCIEKSETEELELPNTRRGYKVFRAFGSGFADKMPLSATEVFFNLHEFEAFIKEKKANNQAFGNSPSKKSSDINRAFSKQPKNENSETLEQQPSPYNQHIQELESKVLGLEDLLQNARAFKDSEEPHYSKELHIAVDIWEELRNKEIVKQSPKQTILKILSRRFPNLTSKAKERIAMLLNWEKKGGSPPTT